MMKCAIASLYLDNFIEIGKITDENKIKYCSTHGYDFICERNNLDFIGFDKIEILINNLPKYDYIWWNDADSLITNFSTKIEDRVFKGYDLIISWDELFLNAGSFIIKNSDESMDFLKLIMSYKETWKHNPAAEQGVITALFNHDKFQQSSFYQKIKVVSQRYLNSFPEERLVKYPNMLQHGIWNKGDWLIHLSGISNEERLKIINKYIEQTV